MEKLDMILQENWLESSVGKELLTSILRRNRRRIFGLLESPSLPPSVDVEEVSYKIFLLGKSGVGKTSLISKLVGTEVPPYHKETPGIQMSVVFWPAKLGNTQQIKMFKLVFWDAGEGCLKKFDHIDKACKKDADAVIYTFSLQNKTSWKDLEPLITRSEVDDSVLKVAVGTKYDQIDAKDSIHEEIRNFEQAWKIPVLKIANIDGPLLPDGVSLNGRASIKEISPFLNNLVSLLWMHDQTEEDTLKRSSAVMTMTSQLARKPKTSRGGVRMPVDDDYDDRSSNHSSTSSSRRSVGEKLPVTYC